MKIALLKLSGKMIDTFTTDKKWISVVAAISNSYDGLILVHGAGSAISRWSEVFGLRPEFIEGQRVTCEKTVEVVAAVQSGLMNTKIVSHLCTNGFNAMGLTGIDRGLFVAKSLDPRLGFVGKPEIAGESSWIIECMERGVIPVFSSLCRDSEGNIMNVNADLFAEALARVLVAHTVMFISDVDAVMINGEKAHYLSENDITTNIANGNIKGGMIPKVNSALQLLKDGISNIWIGSDPEDLPFEVNKSTSRKGTWIALY